MDSDNEPDYESCSLRELRDVLAHIDGPRFPKRKIRVEKEIEARLLAASSQSSDESSETGILDEIDYRLTTAWLLIISGAIFLVVILYHDILNAASDLTVWSVVFLFIATYSCASGYLLLLDRKVGYWLSVVILWAQVPQLTSGVLTWVINMYGGVYFFTGTAVDRPDVGVSFDLASSALFGINMDIPFLLKINLVPLILVLGLLSELERKKDGS